ncbi:DAO-domain-containing protein [Schizophyllum commune H4-8]|nr:DAO-domain-containing protein [Schizophyllum commune H4-8]KAI5892836.1 DAO-domain-containing protein [Schizophyllum commune H4-8]
MGSILSAVYLAYDALSSLYTSYSRLTSCLALSPGIPVSNPTLSFWTVPPSRISKENSGACHSDDLEGTRLLAGFNTSDEGSHDPDNAPKLPSYADVVIIGSGITGTSVARALLMSGKPLRILMLDARDACDGATGRNGGHITPPTYLEWSQLKARVGLETACQVVRFRLQHIEDLLEVAREEDALRKASSSTEEDATMNDSLKLLTNSPIFLLNSPNLLTNSPSLLTNSQCRRTDSYDVFFDEGLFKASCAKLEEYLADNDDLEEKVKARYRVVGKEECVESLHLEPKVAGAIRIPGGAMFPYRFVTGILERLLDDYADSFSLFTHTPCTAICQLSSGTGYVVDTPNGRIRTSHVVHATNAHASHLLECLRERIVPLRATMSQQELWVGGGEPGAEGGHGGKPPATPEWFGTRAFTLYPSASTVQFDYLTQQLAGDGASATSKLDSDQATSASVAISKATASTAPTIRKSLTAYPPPRGELMLGGGFLHHTAALDGNGVLDNADLGCADDSGVDIGTAAYVSGALGAYFRKSSGIKDRVNVEVWTGIIGISADFMPWVGRVPAELAERSTSELPTASESETATKNTLVDSDNKAPNARALLAPSGEWVAAGFSGEGMVHAWICARALARMILQEETDDNLKEATDDPAKLLPDDLPEPFLFTQERWKKASLDGMMAALAE